jgi:integrase
MGSASAIAEVSSKTCGRWQTAEDVTRHAEFVTHDVTRRKTQMRGEKLLDVKTIDSAVKAGKAVALKDGGGLVLRIDPNRSRWVFRFTFAGRGRDIGLGGYPGVGLAAARAARDEARQLVHNGVDPVAARRPAATSNSIPTFAEAALAYVEKHGAGWNATHRHQWAMTTGSYCGSIASKLVSEITTLDVQQLLAVVHKIAPVTAHRLRTRIAAVIDETWMLHPWSETLVNVAAFKRLVPKRSDPVRHHPAIPFAEIPAFASDLRRIEAVAARALEFCLLTATRTGETLGARWEEIDTEARLWTIPASRMKGNREHIVPLSARTLEIVETMALTRENGFIFPGRSRGGCLNPIALQSLMRKGRAGASVHGLRSSFRDWAGDVADAPREVAEAALAHVVGGVEGAYRRGTALDRRARLMEDWARFCDGAAGADTVTSLDTFRKRA